MNTPYILSHSVGIAKSAQTAFDEFQNKLCIIYPEARNDIGGFLFREMNKYGKDTPEYNKLIALYEEYSILVRNNMGAITALKKSRKDAVNDSLNK